MNRIRFAEAIFWVHVIIFIIWFGLFFVPTSIWHNKVLFHFWYILILVSSEILTGLVMQNTIGKFRIICPLTMIMQKLRGYDIKNPINHDHSFVNEFVQRFGIKLPYGFVGALIFLSLGFVIIQFIFYFI